MAVHAGVEVIVLLDMSADAALPAAPGGDSDADNRHAAAASAMLARRLLHAPWP
jgi:hypothetical protein